MATLQEMKQLADRRSSESFPARSAVRVLLHTKSIVERMRGIHPDVPIWLAAIDEGPDSNAYILRALGDAGDRAYGTKQAGDRFSHLRNVPSQTEPPRGRDCVAIKVMISDLVRKDSRLNLLTMPESGRCPVKREIAYSFAATNIHG